MTLELIQQQAFEQGVRSSIKGDTLRSSRRFPQEIIDKHNLEQDFFDEEDGDDDSGRPIIRKIFTYKQKS